jgi:hypothetical protein
MKSYAIENIKRYRIRQRNEMLKVVAYHIGEAITITALFVVWLLLFSLLSV